MKKFMTLIMVIVFGSMAWGCVTNPVVGNGVLCPCSPLHANCKDCCRSCGEDMCEELCIREPDECETCIGNIYAECTKHRCAQTE